MSGAAGPGGGGDHGRGRLYGDRHPPACFGDDDPAGSTFVQDPACSAGGDAAYAGLTPYSSLTDYLQGFLDPAGLARHLDAPTGDPISPASAAPLATPNSPTSSEQRLSERGTPAPEEEDESADHQNCRSGTPEKKKEKKARGSRVAFATKSEVDHLDDGYRWRKYGQKAVKNSSFPRSYYRCTTAQCGVKKQVERSQQDPSTVVTTYEGQHKHPSPGAHRGMANSLYSLASFEQQRHGLCPPSPDDLLHKAARAMAPTAAANALSVALLPHPSESRFVEYYGVQLHDVLLSCNQYGHR